MAEILIAFTDGLKRMPEAFAIVFQATTLQPCIVYLIGNSLDYTSWKERKALTAIKLIYTGPSTEPAMAEPEAFDQGRWGEKFPTVAAA